MRASRATRFFETRDGSTLVEVTYDYTPGRPGSFYARNGDPGDPPESSEIEIVSAKLDDGSDYVFTDEEFERFADRVDDDPPKPDAPDVPEPDEDPFDESRNRPDEES
jgi:hypothetical protein